MLLSLFLACSSPPPAPPPAPVEPETSPVDAAPAPHVPAAFLFTRHPEHITKLEIPKTSHRLPVPDYQPMRNWKLVWSEGGVDRYEAPVPYRQSLVGEPPAGVTVKVGNKVLPYDAKDTAGTWGVANPETVALRLRTGAKVPEVRLRNEDAVQRDHERSLGESGLEPQDFLLSTERMKQVRRAGLFLPAPAEVTFSNIPIPKGARFNLGMSLLLPIADTAEPSDGAFARIDIGENGKWTNLTRMQIDPGDWKRGSLELGRWAGRTVDIRFQSEPGAVTHEDYIFFDEPEIYVPKTNPERVILVIIDTLRRDHVGVYGAKRPTTPQIDAWAKDALVFDQARSAAPWTLPSVRMALSGVPPERWDKSETLPERLGAHGFETLAVVSNAYLSRTFRMEEVFSTHIYQRRAAASDITRLATEQMARLEGRDGFVVLHFMDAHLPYASHPDTLDLFVKNTPPSVTRLANREDFVAAATANEPGVREWIQERYDENIRSIDNALGPFLAALPDDATVIVMSDHGEEFWDHEGFEHGHTLYDELTHVVLMAKGPGITAGRTDAEVSLVDLSPTVLDRLGLPPIEDSIGASFESVLLGLPFERGPLPLGYVLFGEDQWGYLDKGTKGIAGAHGFLSFDIAKDPLEKTSTPPDPEVYRRELEAAWKRPAKDAMRVMFPRTATERPHRIAITVPGGIAAVWNGIEGPEANFAAPVVDGDTATVVASEHAQMPYEVYIAPTDWSRATEVTFKLDAREIRIVDGGEEPGKYYELSQGGNLSAARTIVPVPVEGSFAAIDAAANAELKALGYVE